MKQAKDTKFSGRWGQLIPRLAAWQQEAMFQKLVKKSSLAPRLTVSKLILYVLSLFVHLTTVFFMVGGLYVLFSDDLNLGSFLGGGFLLMCAWAFRPHFGRLTDMDYLTREKYPSLFALIDRIAASIEVKTPDIVTYDYIYNAMFGRVGLRQKSWLHLGMGLWMKLSPRARIALIAHELAHDSNGDSARMLWVSGAFQTIVGWYNVIVPHQVFGAGIMPFESVFYLILYLLSRPIYLVIWLYVLLLLYDSRRAEYLADELASRVVGTQAVIELHRHMPQTAPEDISPLLFSHPSGEYRIRFLSERAEKFGEVRTTDAEMRKIDEELAGAYKQMYRELAKFGVIDY